MMGKKHAMKQHSTLPSKGDARWQRHMKGSLCEYSGGYEDVWSAAATGITLSRFGWQLWKTTINYISPLFYDIYYEQ